MSDPIVITDKGALATARKLESIQIAIREMQLIESGLRLDLKDIAAAYGPKVKIGRLLIVNYVDADRSMYAITGDGS